MAFRLRRGTDAERLLITPEEGELIYTTDTKQVYVGDGTTLGGNIVSEDLGLDDLDEVDISSTPPTNGQVLVWRTDKFVPETISVDGSGIGITEGTIYSIDIQGRVIANDSSVVVDPNLGLITANDIFSNTISADTIDATTQFTGDLVGNVSGNLTGNVDAVDQIYSPLIFAGNVEATTVSGDILYRDSTVFFNASDGNITANEIAADQVNAVFMSANFFEGTHNGPVTGDLRGSVFSDDSTLVIDGTTGNINANRIIGDGALEIDNGQGVEIVDSDDFASLKIIRRDLTADISSPSPVSAYGTIRFDREDINGTGIGVYVQGGSDGFKVFNLADGSSFSSTTSMHLDMSGNLVVGGSGANEKLDIRGNGVFEGFVQFGSLTTAERDALTAANGMVIYNTTDNKFQGYENGSWVNLI